MLQLDLNLTDVKDFAKRLPNLKEELFSIMRLDLKQTAIEFLNGLMEAEFSLFIGRDKYQREPLAINSRFLRNGHYQRSFAVKGLGKLLVKIPRDRAGEFKTQVLEPYKRMEVSLEEDLAVMYLMGLSTRGLSLISKRLIGTEVSHDKVSSCAGRLVQSVESWRTRPITEDFKYLYLDGTNFSMRIDGSIEKVNILVVIGVSEAGHKQVIALQAGDKESAPNWRELFKDLKKRGLKGDKIQLGIMDGLPGLEKVFLEEFKCAKVQRCQVHVARNVMSKVPQKLRQEVADGVRSVFYASTEKKARYFFDNFKKKYEGEIPSAVKCLESSLNETLTYLKFPTEEAKALRTTNPIERLNKEFKRRTKSMEIVAGETSCYNLLAVICLRMELYWKRRPITLKGSLPWLTDDDKFTQKI
jgi:putative transposase